MKVVVTGGAGFIGSHTVDLLVSSGHEVVVLDLLEPGAHARRPGYLNPGAEYVFEDVRSPEAWERCLSGADGVCHLAAKVGLGVSPEDVADYVEANDVGTATMLRAMFRSVYRGRLVLASSMVVYGEGSYRCPAHGTVRPAPRDRGDLAAGRFEPGCPSCGRPLSPQPVDETTPVDPRNFYAATKVHQEHLCSVLAREAGIAFTALRYHNVYGPRMPRDTPYAGVASLFRSALEAGDPPRVFEDGRQLRDFVHVQDVAAANVLALTAEPAVPGALNIATGDPRSVGEMAGALADAFGSGSPRPVVTGEFRLGDVRHVFASADRAAHVLGFRTEVSFDAGMREFATDELRDSVPSA